jgi:hypothetical protein
VCSSIYRLQRRRKAAVGGELSQRLSQSSVAHNRQIYLNFTAAQRDKFLAVQQQFLVATEYLWE